MTLEIKTPNIGNMTPFPMAAKHPKSRTGISGLLREARRLNGTSGPFSLVGKFSSSSGSATLIPVGKPNETENEWRLLFPIDDPLLIDL
jgi:hypothetical protein